MNVEYYVAVLCTLRIVFNFLFLKIWIIFVVCKKIIRNDSNFKIVRTVKQLLFVCLGNICRSPAAEAVMIHKLKKTGLDKFVTCDSAGIIGFHAGQPADSRMKKLALRRGYEVASISRAVIYKIDFNQFDMIIGMDDQNIADLNKLALTNEHRLKIFKMTDFSTKFEYDHIPDPYYGGNDAFELVLDLLEDACDGLISHLNTEGEMNAIDKII